MGTFIIPTRLAFPFRLFGSAEVGSSYMSWVSKILMDKDHFHVFVAVCAVPPHIRCKTVFTIDHAIYYSIASTSNKSESIHR